MQKPVVEPLKRSAGSNPGRSAGQQCTPIEESGRLPSRSWVGRTGGHERLRCSRGEAGGKELGTYPVNRSAVNVSNPEPPNLPTSQVGSGQWAVGSGQWAVGSGQWASLPSAHSPGVGQSPGSSPRPGKPATWRRRAASPQRPDRNVRRSPVNTDASWPDRDEAWWRVLKIQTKLHQGAIDDSARRFDDLFNLVCDPIPCHSLADLGIGHSIGSFWVSVDGEQKLLSPANDMRVFTSGTHPLCR